MKTQSLRITLTDHNPVYIYIWGPYNIGAYIYRTKRVMVGEGTCIGVVLPAFIPFEDRQEVLSPEGEAANQLKNSRAGCQSTS